MRALLAAAILAGSALSASAKDVQIVVYHTNDIHGWIMPRQATFSSRPNDPVGGLAALASVVKKDRRPKLLLDAGDWFQGTPEGNLSKGQSLVDGFNALGYDAVEVGNHDYDAGQARLEQLVAGLKMPALGANVYRGGRRVDYLRPWIIKKVAGVKVGIFGLLTTNMPNLTFAKNIQGLTFRDEVDEAREDVAALRKAGATVVIAVTHVGYESDKLGKFAGDQTIAREVPGIDLIVGGHSHTFVREPEHEPTHGTLIVQDGSYLTDVGQVTLTVDSRTGKVKASSGKLITLWLDEYGQDAAAAAVLKPYEDQVAKEFDVVVATADKALTRNPQGESSLGDWITDCARDYSHADLAVQNSGGIRADLPAGPVTLRELYDIMPFDNYVTNLVMKGGLVRDTLDHGVNKQKGMIQVSGASFGYDRDAADGARLADVSIGGKPLDPKASYKVVSLDFLVRGGDGFTPFGRAESKDFTQVLWRDMLRACAQREKTIVPPAMGRMTPSQVAAAAGGKRGP